MTSINDYISEAKRLSGFLAHAEVDSEHIEALSEALSDLKEKIYEKMMSEYCLVKDNVEVVNFFRNNY